MNPPFYVSLSSPYGTLGLVWQETEQGPKVKRVFLPGAQTSVEDLVKRVFVGVRPLSRHPIAELGGRIQSFLAGEEIDFELESIALENCSSFQQRVLLAEHEIPRGWVSTYGRIAKSLGTPSGARVVGQALAENPFPIIIPCHRAIRSNGELGGYQGGQKMKSALLELEGIEFSPSGKVVMRQVHYQ